MPIYEYRRPDGTTFELRQSFSDPPLMVDPDTGVPVERVLHAPAVHFKGKGFYTTDYGKRAQQRESAAAGGESSPAGGEKAGAEKAGASSDGKSENGAKAAAPANGQKPVPAKGAGAG